MMMVGSRLRFFFLGLDGELMMDHGRGTIYFSGK